MRTIESKYLLNYFADRSSVSEPEVIVETIEVRLEGDQLADGVEEALSLTRSKLFEECPRPGFVPVKLSGAAREDVMLYSRRRSWAFYEIEIFGLKAYLERRAGVWVLKIETGPLSMEEGLLADLEVKIRAVGDVIFGGMFYGEPWRCVLGLFLFRHDADDEDVEDMILNTHTRATSKQPTLNGTVGHSFGTEEAGVRVDIFSRTREETSPGKAPTPVRELNSNKVVRLAFGRRLVRELLSEGFENVNCNTPILEPLLRELLSVALGGEGRPAFLRVVDRERFWVSNHRCPNSPAWEHVRESFFAALETAAKSAVPAPADHGIGHAFKKLLAKRFANTIPRTS